MRKPIRATDSPLLSPTDAARFGPFAPVNTAPLYTKSVYQKLKEDSKSEEFGSSGRIRTHNPSVNSLFFGSLLVAPPSTAYIRLVGDTVVENVVT
jgi:hypothetical protein